MKNIFSKLFVIVSILIISANFSTKTNYNQICNCIKKIEHRILLFMSLKNKESLTDHTKALFSILDSQGQVLAHNDITKDFHKQLRIFAQELEKLKGMSTLQVKYKIQVPFSILEKSYNNVIAKINKQCSKTNKNSQELNNLKKLKMQVTQLIQKIDQESNRLGMWGRASLWKLRNK